MSLNVILDYILATYSQINSSPIYVIAHSMGGLGAWDWIQKNPERFIAIAPCGFRSISGNTNTNILRNIPVFTMVGGGNGKNIASVKKWLYF